MKSVLVLGPGCAKCNKLFENVQLAIDGTGIDCDLKKVTDINEITSYDVLMTPALVIDGAVKSSGSVPNVEAIKTLLMETQNES